MYLLKKTQKKELFGFICHLPVLAYVGANGTPKQEFVIEITTNQDYPEYVPFECFGKPVDNLPSLAIGQKVKVEYYPSGNKWEKDGKTMFFAKNKAISVEVLEQPQKPVSQPAPVQVSDLADNDDLPF